MQNVLLNSNTPGPLGVDTAHLGASGEAINQENATLETNPENAGKSFGEIFENQNEIAKNINTGEWQAGLQTALQAQPKISSQPLLQSANDIILDAQIVPEQDVESDVNPDETLEKINTLLKEGDTDAAAKIVEDVIQKPNEADTSGETKDAQMQGLALETLESMLGTDFQIPLQKEDTPAIITNTPNSEATELKLAHGAQNTGQAEKVKVAPEQKDTQGAHKTDAIPLVNKTAADPLMVDAENISGEIPEVKAQKTENASKKLAEQKILDELNLNIEKILVSEGPVQSVPPSKTTASAGEQMVKMSIETENAPQIKVDIENPGANMQNMQQSNQESKATQATQSFAQTLKEVNKDDVLGQIGMKFDQLKNSENSKITMTLRPVELGRLTIELTQNHRGVTTNIVAQSQQVKELLEKNIDALRQQLGASGVNVQNINIKVAANDANANSSESFDQNEDERSGQEDSDKKHFGRDTSSDTSKENNKDDEFV